MDCNGEGILACNRHRRTTFHAVEELKSSVATGFCGIDCIKCHCDCTSCSANFSRGFSTVSGFVVLITFSKVELRRTWWDCERADERSKRCGGRQWEEGNEEKRHGGGCCCHFWYCMMLKRLRWMIVLYTLIVWITLQGNQFIEESTGLLLSLFLVSQ